VHVQPDRAARYDTVAAVLTASQRVGLPKVGVVGLEQFAP
jgi:biopolymer transport protein ExbD